MTITTRRAEPTEADVALVAPLFDAYRQFYGQPADGDRARAFVRDRLVHEESVIVLATRGGAGGEAVGFVQLYPSFSSVSACRIWILNDLYVVAEARREGVAAALMEAARAHAASTGARRIVLATARDNAPARALYERLGYRAEEGFVEYALEVGRDEG